MPKSRIQEIVKLIVAHDKKGLRRLKNRLFKGDILEGFDFVAALIKVMNSEPRVYTFAMDNLWYARNRLLELENDRFLEIISLYYKLLSEKGVSFEIATILGVTKAGEFKQAKQFFSQCLEIIRRLRLPENKVKQWSLFCGMSFMLSLIASCRINKTWNNLIAGAKKDDGIRDILKEVLSFFLFYGSEKFELITANEWSIDFSKQAWMPLKAMKAVQILPVTRLPVLPDDKNFLGQVLEEIFQEAEKSQKELVKLIDWFKSNLERLAEHFETMWQDIQGDPQCWVRPAGSDCIQIDIIALKTIGYRLLQFSSEAMTFPSVNVKYWIQEEVTDFSLSFALDEQKLLNYSGEKKLSGPRAIVDFILAYIALHCLWRIVTKQDHGPTAGIVLKQTGKVKSGRFYKKILKSDRITFTLVRPFFRHLPEGHSVSAFAIAEAEEILKTPPPKGKTFVHDYKRGNVESEVAPLFSYSEKDLGFQT